jgi:hypothetical protein
MSLMPMKQTGWGVPIDGGYGLPDDVYKTRAERKRRLADALKKESTMPQGQMVSGIYVAPSITQYLASGLKGYKANQMEKEAETEWETGAKQQQQRMTSAQQKYLEALRPQSVQTGETKQPFESSQMDRFGTPMQGQQQQTTPVMGQRQPTPEELYTAQMQFATDLNDPQAMMTAANNRISGIEKQQTREDDQLFKQEQAQLQREQIAANLQAQIQAANQRGEDTRQMQYTLAQMNNASREDLARLTASLKPEPQAKAPVSVMGPDGQPMFVSPEQAYGQRPYSAAQEAKDAVKIQSQSAAGLSAQQAIDQAALLMGHKGRQMGTGTSSWTGSVPIIASDSKDFQKNLDTFKAQTFVPMVSAMKGMGALSDAEGKKLTDSVGALDPNMSEKAFEDSLRAVTKTLYDKAKASGLNVSMPSGMERRKLEQTGTIKPPPGAVRRKN